MNILRSMLLILAALVLLIAMIAIGLYGARLINGDLSETAEEQEIISAVDPISTTCVLKGFEFIVTYEYRSSLTILNPSTGRTAQIPKSLAFDVCEVYQQ